MALIAPPTMRIDQDRLESDDRQHSHSHRDEDRADDCQWPFAELFGEPADESALHRSDDNTKESVIESDLPIVETESVFVAEEERDHAFEHDESGHADERDEQKLHELGVAEDRVESAGMQPPAELRRLMDAAFLQSEESLQHGDEAHGRGEIAGQCRMNRDQQCAEGGPHGESYAEGCAEDAHSAGAVLWGGDIADVRLGCRDISAAESVDESGAINQRAGRRTG